MVRQVEGPLAVFGEVEEVAEERVECATAFEGALDDIEELGIERDSLAGGGEVVGRDAMGFEGLAEAGGEPAEGGEPLCVEELPAGALQALKGASEVFVLLGEVADAEIERELHFGGLVGLLDGVDDGREPGDGGDEPEDAPVVDGGEEDGSVLLAAVEHEASRLGGLNELAQGGLVGGGEVGGCGEQDGRTDAWRECAVDEGVHLGIVAQGGGQRGHVRGERAGYPDPERRAEAVEQAGLGREGATHGCLHPHLRGGARRWCRGPAQR